MEISSHKKFLKSTHFRSIFLLLAMFISKSSPFRLESKNNSLNISLKIKNKALNQEIKK